MKNVLPELTLKINRAFNNVHPVRANNSKIDLIVPGHAKVRNHHLPGASHRANKHRPFRPYKFTLNKHSITNNLNDLPATANVY